jgi:hypothetical protein
MKGITNPPGTTGSAAHHITDPGQKKGVNNDKEGGVQ